MLKMILSKEFCINYIRVKLKSLYLFISSFFFKYLYVNTKQGRFKLPVAKIKKDPISSSLFYFSNFELDICNNTMNVLEKINDPMIGNNRCLLDIGANNGVICIGFLVNKYFQSAIAIEPDPTNFQLLEENVELNRLKTKIHCKQIAMSDNNSIEHLFINKTNLGDHRLSRHNSLCRESILVATTTADAVCDSTGLFESISLIWIDVQGWEIRVLSGAKRLMEKKIPIGLEFWPFGLSQNGFSVKDFILITKTSYKYYYNISEEIIFKHNIDELIQYDDRINDELFAINILVADL